MENTTNKISELIDLGLDIVRNGGVFGLVTPSYARRMSVFSFIGGAIVGAGITGALFMRGNSDLAETLRLRFEELRDAIKERVEKVTQSSGSKSDEAEPVRPS